MLRSLKGAAPGMETFAGRLETCLYAEKKRLASTRGVPVDCVVRDDGFERKAWRVYAEGSHWVFDLEAYLKILGGLA